MNGKIVVQINKGAETIETVRDAPNQRVEAVDREKSSIQSSAVSTALIQAGTQAITSTINQYGDLTGDYITANAISDITNIAADALMIAKGGIVGVVAVATRKAIQAGQTALQAYRANKEVEFIRQRTGNVTINDGRYY
jgi:hypothetical protein